VNHMNKKKCEELWAKNKYYVLSKSHKVYLEIRNYLKEKEIDIVFINERNFKKKATKIEKQELFNILEEYMGGRNNQKSLIEYINTLLKKYPNKYLQESALLTGEKDETMA